MIFNAILFDIILFSSEMFKKDKITTCLWKDFFSDVQGRLENFLHDAMMDSLWRLWEQTLWWSLFAMWLCSSAYQMVSLHSCLWIWVDFVSCFDQ